MCVLALVGTASAFAPVSSFSGSALTTTARDVVFKFIHEVRADDVTFIADDWRSLPAAATTALYKDLRCSSTVASRTRRQQQLLRRSRAAYHLCLPGLYIAERCTCIGPSASMSSSSQQLQ
eukprot:10921-Heterococcus_DN1.PRE.1